MLLERFEVAVALDPLALDCAAQSIHLALGLFVFDRRDVAGGHDFFEPLQIVFVRP